MAVKARTTSTTRAASNSHRLGNPEPRRVEHPPVNKCCSTVLAPSSEVGRQQATANSRGYSLLNTSERTALTVAQVYLDVLTRREFVRLAEDNLKSHERIFDQIKLRTSVASEEWRTWTRPKRGWLRRTTT